MLQNKILKCKDCGINNEPIRCPDCRRAKKLKKQLNNTTYRR